MTPSAQRLRATAGFFLRHLIDGAVCERTPTGTDIFATGEIDVVADGVRSAASDQITGLTMKLNGTASAALVVAGTPVPDEPGWERIDAGSLRCAGVMIAPDAEGVEPILEMALAH